ncbi:DUF4328 domain-containing protein [Catellatospora coxensis]|uniref:DUF4328 domain-containing protein n=1 Tax=Catellatospora coxensis TaxID=310354 RepID=A0A8J3KYT3_9ACTN|nr:DUF4328 domain-containing protein [Catellatospora coxensis]GIG04570.1 hypothetical protein Cco03nite_12700 [Catellatospora coxensis]
MTCPHCSAVNAAPGIYCHACGLDRTAPLIHPHAKVYAVHGIGLAAVAAVVVSTVLTVLGAVLALVPGAMAEQAQADRDTDLLQRAYLVELAITGMDVLGMLVAGVLVIIWLYRARVNIDAFPEVHPGLAAGWAIGGWFIPFANFVVPCRVMHQVAAASLPHRRVGALTGLWWAGYVVSLATSQISGRMEPDTNTFSAHVAYFGDMFTFGLVEAVGTVLAGFFLVTLILSISRAQSARIERGRAAHVPVVPAAVPSGTISL